MYSSLKATNAAMQEERKYIAWGSWEGKHKMYKTR
jgi:hypothetical protein